MPAGLPGRTTMATTDVATTLLLGARSRQPGLIRPASSIFMMSRGNARAAMSAGRPSMTARACEVSPSHAVPNMLRTAGCYTYGKTRWESI